jgi:glycosyltransferase involved in cell wall biosynthesis
VLLSASSIFANHEIPEISVVLPSYNEGTLLSSTIEALSNHLSSLQRKYEIIISDDGSVDATSGLNWSKYHTDFCVSYLRSNVTTGKGGALKRGLLSCSGKFIFFTDVDLPVELEALSRSLALLENNKYDIVIGDRRLTDSKVVGTAPIHRHVASKIFNIGVQALILPGFKDTQCPMKAFTADVLHKLLPATCLTSYAFDAELLYLATLHNLRIKRMPVFWKDTRTNLPKEHLVSVSFSWLKDLVSTRLRNRQVDYQW